MMMSDKKIEIFDSKQDIYPYVADLIADLANKAIAERGKFTVALTGGSSPVEIYKLLATDAYSDRIDWSKIFIFWGDERWVPLEDDLSNAKMSKSTLLDHIDIPANHIFPMYNGSFSASEYAVEYEKKIKEIVGESGVFDLILLGMGDDGHTASLFPGTEVLKEKSKWVDAYFLDNQDMYRITLTEPCINAARYQLVITFGEKKAPALKEVIAGAYNPEKYPSQLLKPTHGELLFVVDVEAAKLL